MTSRVLDNAGLFLDLEFDISGVLNCRSLHTKSRIELSG